MPADRRLERVRTMMTSAVGPLKADSLMRRIAAEEAPGPGKALEIARWLEPEVIVPLVADEFPQTIAVLLVQLDPQVAARVLAGLPDEAQPDVVHRVATLGPVAPAALAMLAELLESRIAETFGAMPLSMGGVREVAEIINQAGKAAEQRSCPASPAATRGWPRPSRTSCSSSNICSCSIRRRWAHCCARSIPKR